MYGWRGGTCQEEQSRCEGTEAAWMQVFMECSQSGEGGGWRACEVVEMVEAAISLNLLLFVTAA